MDNSRDHRGSLQTDIQRGVKGDWTLRVSPLPETDPAGLSPVVSLLRVRDDPYLHSWDFLLTHMAGGFLYNSGRGR